MAGKERSQSASSTLRPDRSAEARNAEVVHQPVNGWMFIQRGIPAICGYGVQCGGVHGADGWAGLESLQKVTEVYVQIVIRFLSEALLISVEVPKKTPESTRGNPRAWYTRFSHEICWIEARSYDLRESAATYSEGVTMNPEEFRQVGHQLIDWIADYRAHLADFPVMVPVEPGAIRAQLPAAPPVSAESFDGMFRDLEQIIFPGLLHWQHPHFYGYFPANGELSSVLGDYLSTGLGVIGLSWQASPALSELEEVVTDWVRQMVDLSPAWSGVIQDTASTSALVALICARERTSAYGLARGGLQGEEKPLVVYTSSQSHSSVEKGALLAGFGRANVRAIATDERYAMRADALAAAIEADLAHGLLPCAIVATSGTTATTALDPIEEIARIARRYHLWLHVDAAMAGSAMILPECRWMWQGIEGADSLVLNAHKWLGAVFDTSLYFVRDPEHLVRVMSTNPSFLQSAVDDQVKNLRDWGIPLGRRFRALKLWFLIREQGVTGLQARLRRDIANARWLAEQIQAAENWCVLAPVVLQTVCVRHEPPGLTGEDLDRHTLAWLERVNSSGEAYLTPAQIDGCWMVRISLGSLLTERAHVEALWALLRRQVTRAE